MLSRDEIKAPIWRLSSLRGIGALQSPVLIGVFAMNNFLKIKESKLSSVDLSKKGSIDESIVHIIEFINSRKALVTTSSCSGRIIVVSPAINEDSSRKKGCNWIFTSHSTINPEDLVESALKDAPNLIFKFEPFILHVQCQILEDAQKLAVRSTHGLEVPLSCGNQLMVSTEYLHFLAKVANEKMTENNKRIQKFYDQICQQFSDRLALA